MSEKNKSKVEIIKENSNRLRGTISQQLDSNSVKFDKEGYELLKFHGIYQQDDRDLRQQLKKEGKDRKYIFMVRTKNPGGGELTPEQWLAHDEAADRFTDGTLRITTRQDIQFHGVGKENLKDLVKHLNSKLISSYGACGDGNRNTMADPVSDIRKGSVFNSLKLAKTISDELTFKSNAYMDIWLDGEKYDHITRNKDESEDLYGKTYMPRKFKIGIGQEIDNSVDVHTQDIGIVPVIIDNQVQGFTIFIGGGLGSNHRQKKTYPRHGTPLALVNQKNIMEVVKSILEFQRDNGDRKNRKHARLKYVVEEWGIEKVKADIENRLGYRLDDPVDVDLKQPADHYGWHEQNIPGLWYLGLFIENGRIRNTDISKTKKGLKEIISKYRPGVRLTPLQDIILTNIPEDKIEEIEQMLDNYGIRSHENYSRLRLNSMACPALPTCGLALAESERYLPTFMEELEKRGYGDEDIRIRMSGCPNACSRPTTSEIGIMGASPGKYNVYVGGDYEGTRLNSLYKELVSDVDLSDLVSDLLDVYQSKRNKGERFGDFCYRIGNDELRSLVDDINGICSESSMAG